MTALTADEVQHDVDQVWRYFVGTYWALTTVSGADVLKSYFCERRTRLVLFAKPACSSGQGAAVLDESEVVQAPSRYLSSNVLPKTWMTHLLCPHLLQIATVGFGDVVSASACW